MMTTVESRISSSNNHKKRKIRSIISPIDGVMVDESDFKVVDQIFKDCVHEIRRYMNLTTAAGIHEAKLLDIRTIFRAKDDACCRIHQLTILETGQQSLPENLLRLDALESLKIIQKKLPIPMWLCDLPNLRKLTIFLEEGQALPPEILSLPSLQVLEIYGGKRTSFPSKSAILNSNSNLRELSISVENVPHEIGYFTNLRTLRLGPDCKSIPASIFGNLNKNLQTLVFQECHDWCTLPEQVGELKNLQVLRVFSCSGLTSLPKSIGNLASTLRVLDLDDSSGLTKLPQELASLTQLEYLNLKGCLGLCDDNALVPIEGLQNLKALNLSEMDAVLPDTIGDTLGKLERLDVSHAKFASFPSSLGNFKNLKDLNLEGCMDDDGNRLQDFVGRWFPDIVPVCNELENLHIENSSNDDRSETDSTSPVPGSKTLVEPSKKNLGCSFPCNIPTTKGSPKQRRAL